MKISRVFIVIFFMSYNVLGQNRIESFPELTSFIDPKFANVDNIFPIAFIHMKIDNKDFKIPISYSLFHHETDRSNFLIKGDYIDNYSFEVSKNGKCRPLFKRKTFDLPPDYKQFLDRTRKNYDSIRYKVDLNYYLKFFTEPDWWQNDATPEDENGKPLKFICQLELYDITTDDCSLYIFFDTKKRLVRQIYQRD